MRLLAIGLAIAVSATAHAKPARILRVCADPNNFPFSSEKRAGFEDEIARVIARELGARVQYTWWAQRRGFFRNTLKAETCDVVMGVPVGIGMARTTAPYYRSSYAFVTRADRKLALASLDDKRLRTLRIGVPLVGDDGANSPPAHALAARGIIDNVVGFTPYSNYRKDSPAADIVRAVIDGKVDVAIVWAPLAAGYATRTKVRLRITPIETAVDHGEPLHFAIGLGVRHKDKELAAELERAMHARRVQIAAILSRWGVPQLPLEEDRS